MIELDRRAFGLGVGASFLSALSAQAGETLDSARTLLASAYRDQNGDFGFAVIDSKGQIIWQETLPARGHSIIANSRRNKGVAFARRPGNFAVAFDPHKENSSIIFHSPLDRHFYGHGVFSLNDKLLFTTENDFENGIGKIGIYDATANFVRMGEFDSFGIGSHDLMLMPDGKTLCVANGGIETHPDFGRTKLNIPSMEPSVAFISMEDGSLKERHTLPAKLSKLSTRHMALNDAGDVWVGCQYQGSRSDQPPLLMRLRQGKEMNAVSLADKVTAKLSNYVGSIAFNQSTDTIMITSPKGGYAVELDAKSGKVVSELEQKVVCGVAAANESWAFSTLSGNLNGVQTAVQWDNHLLSL